MRPRLMVKVNADLHNHLRTGSDMSRLNFNEVINIASQRLGEYGILGLINFEDKRYEQFLRLEGYKRVNLGNGFYVPEKKLLVVKGQEIPTKQGHVIVLGTEKDKHLKSGMDLESTVEEALKSNGIIIADHPFYHAGLGSYLEQNPSLIEFFDGFEVYNSEAELWVPRLLPRNANKKAMEFYEQIKNYKQIKKELEIGALFCSDGHSLVEIGRSYIQLEIPEYKSIQNADDLIKCLRSAIRNNKLPYGKMESSRFRALIHAGILFFMNVLNLLRIYRS